MRRRNGSVVLLSFCLGLGACSGSIRPGDSTTADDGDGEGGARTPGRTGGNGGPGGPGGGTGGGSVTGGAGVTGGGGTPSACIASNATAVGAGKWRRLTRRQYANTVKDLLGIEANTSNFLADSTTGVFATNTLPPQEIDVAGYASAAEAIAAKAVEDPAKLTGCNVSGADADTCAAKFIKEFGARAYRRELSAEEIANLTTTYKAGKADGVAVGLRLVLQSMLQSPSFLYMVEMGQAGTGSPARLTSLEVATRLSYLLWNTTPDAELFAAARAGKLDTVDGVKGQAKRLMTDQRFAGTLADFHSQLLHLYKLTEGDLIKKDKAPEFDSAMRVAMVNEVKSFVADAFASGQANVKNLFTSRYGFPSGPTVALYGLTPSQLTNGRYEFKDGTRSGLLTSPALMAVEPPIPTPYGAVHRGKMVRTVLMCDELPPPPKELKFMTPPDAATVPQRVLLEQHQNEPSCAGCHRLMDSIGFGLENYDALGRHRTKYPKGETVNSSGEIVASQDIDGRFANPQELGAKLGSSKQVRACLGTHWFRYAYGREPSADDACAVASFADALGQGDGDLPSSLLSFVSSDAFRFRRGVQ